MELDADGVALTIDFGVLGNSAEYKMSGWQEPEQGFTWTLGTQSSLALPSPAVPGRYALELHVSPFVWRDTLSSQRLIVTVNQKEVGRFTVEHNVVLTVEIPWSILEQHAACMVEFEMPDSAQPIAVNGVPDRRSIAIAFDEVRLIRIDGLDAEPADTQRRTKLITTSRLPPGKLPAKPSTEAGLKNLMMGFESLGEDCEFGLVQRRCGAEPLGLLRFSSSPLRKLLAAMEARFEGLGKPEFIKVELSSNGSEYMVSDKRYGLYYHAWVLAGEKSPADIHARECSRLPFLVRKLVEDLQNGEKIFVYRGMTPLAERDVLRLHATMRGYGPSTLLWVEVAEDIDAAGSVEELAPGLLKAHIQRFAPAANAHDFSLDAWIEVCHNADCLKRTISGYGPA